MRFSPFRDFIANVVLNTGRAGWLQADQKLIRKKKRKSRMGALLPAEILEVRAMLAGPQLVSVVPNTGGFLADGQMLTEAPRELTITLSPGAAIDATTVSDSVTVSRPGTDGAWGTSDDLSVPLGYVGVGPLSNQITVRFAESLLVDQYRLTIRGTLLNVDGDAFNNGVNRNLDFRVDFGGQVVSVVPQPVLRSVSLSNLDVSRLRGGDTISIDGGSGPVTFEFVNTQAGGAARPGNIAVNFTPAQTAAQVTTTFLNRLNQSSLAASSTPAARRLTTTVVGNSIALSSSSIIPCIKVQSAQTGVVTVSDGELSQATDTVVVYFNKNPLRTADAENPGFYQLSDVSNGFLRLPQSVSYSATGNNAILKFAAPLPQATYKLTVGAPLSVDETLAQAVKLGTLYANTGSPTLVGFLGDRGGVSNDGRDYDLYAFSTGADGNSAVVSLLQADPSFTNGLRFNVFLADGTPVTSGTISAGGTFNISGLLASTQYWLGISAGAAGGSVITNYNPVTGTPGTAGVGLGSYKVQLSVSGNLTENDETSSFTLSTPLGSLGTAGFTINGSIAPPNTVALPPEPGGMDEPGHRQIPVEGEANDTDNNGQAPRLPTAIKTSLYNFRMIYGQDPQGNDLYNQITEAQKQRAREIFEIYSRYMGVKFIETAEQGLIVAFGDPRAVMPNAPEGALGGIAGENGDGQPIALINAATDYSTQSEFGEAFFNLAIHEIAHSLGFSHSYDAPGIMSGGGESVNFNGVPWKGTELVYPGDVNMVAAQRIYSPFGTDINLYGFRLDQAGTFRAETIAQRLLDASGNPNPSLLDAQLSLFQETYATASVTSDFGTNKTVTIRMAARQSGAAGNNIQVAVTRSALATNAPPAISVVGNTISVVLNTNGGTTAQQLVNALNNDASASALITAEITAGDVTTNLALAATSYSPLRLTGGATNRTLISRNDDYFGRDALLSLPLPAGQYFLAVSAKGNSNFDPTISGTGYGGRTDGGYQLQMSFTPETSAGQSLQSVTSVPFDGNLDSKAGGTFENWFQVAPTIFVDKLNSDDWDPQGTLARPYATISAALSAATAGQIVRIVGNSGTDGQAGTVSDNRSYLIGFDTLGNVAEDGADFIVPKDVTVMIDAGAILKLRGAIIDVGKTVPNIDRSGGVLQVLGTPGHEVQFTSLADDSVGGRSDPNDFVGPDKGQWGGIVFRQSSDFIGLPGRQDGRDWAGRGVFLNSVNQARFQYGGGQVYDDSVLRVFTPIHIENLDGHAARFSRPNIWFNTITSSADAAISAEPNSFANTGDRSGPLVRGNTVTGNSLNAFFIRVRTEFGTPLDTLQLSARIDDTDITYVLSENLIIEGGAGGILRPDPGDPSGWNARIAASLVLDPGVVLKMSGARIEAQIGGSQFLAEGTAARPVVLTSVRDDLYGAGGTFDTGADADAPVAAGDWSGLYFAPNSSGSIDNAVVKYGGGISAVAGSFASFNAIEVQQADVRVAHTLLANNAAGGGSADRDGRLSNANTTVFVRGAQPVLVNNTFVDNLGTAMSFNVNSLNAREVSDWGRRTGFIDAQTQYKNNFGPLIAGNRLGNNAINGIDVRGETVTTEVIWDDADIVHVVRDEIIEDINRHTFGGIRLQSGNESSLVIKLAGPNAGFTVTGIPLDIEDRIGGTLQVIGSASYPVVFTSLNDDTVGAGFLPNGLPQTDTDNDGAASPPQPGSWRSVRLDRYSNDRNVAVALESELTTQPQEQNGTSATAQFLGSLAAPVASDNAMEKKGGNDYQPYGYEVHGVLATAADVDVYSFSANLGTEVWIDISRTSQSLDTVVELVDANGTVLASSNDSLNPSDLTGSATPRGLIKDPMLGGDYYTLNPRDAGMRVVLPGSAAVSTYFVRVRSNGALTSGIYNLQLRMRQVYEAPGSTIRYADIRYATNGVEVLGLPGRSPLGGEAGENSTGTSNFGNPNQLGNLLTSDMNTLSVSGSLSGATQVDWYQFKIEYDLIQAIGGVNAGDKTWSTIFDIDYADGLTRADTVISVFDEDGNLILIGRDSNIADDQPGPTQGNGLTDMSRGTVGKLDPYIGSVQMPTGAATGVGYTYTVAVSSNGQLPQALNGQFVGFGANGLVRLEPVNSVRRIVEDHIGFIGHKTGIPMLGESQLDPVAPAMFPIATAAELGVSVRPYTLQDVVLFGLGGGALGTVNPATGATLYGLAGFSGAIKMRSDGGLYGYRPLSVADSVGEFVRIDPATGNVLATLSSDGIPNADPDADPPEPWGLTSDLVDSFAFTGNSGGYTSWLAVRDSISDNDGNLVAYLNRSRLYRANGTTGQVTDPQNDWQGALNVGGPTTGLANVNGTLFGVSSSGRFFAINPGNQGTATTTTIKDFGVNFTGLSEAPQNLNGGALKNFLFATTAAGQLICFDLSGTERAVLTSPTGTAVSRVNSGVGQITFSPLDFNLWHPTGTRGGDAGHGINISFDNSRELFDDVQGAGGTSFYFGLENAGSAYKAIPGFGGQYGVLTAGFQQDLTSDFANTSIGNNINLPGGAAGSLISNNAFSLAGYTALDKPTLYFNYFLQTEDAQGTGMRDSARVYVSTNNGTTWQMLATNNQKLSSNAMRPDAELPTFLSTSRALNTADANQRIQLLYDNTGGWRQARVDLADFAGQANLKLRFDFSTAGTTLVGSRTNPLATLPGDSFGAGLNSAARGQNNLGEGFYIDDIMVGLAERGEMVTGPSNNTGFFTVPTNPDPLAPQQVLTGAYQLEVRRGEEYGANVMKLAPDIVIPSQFDSNERMSAGWRITGLAGSAVADGATFTVSDGIKTVTYEFDKNSVSNAANRRISITNTDTAASVATKVRDAINAAKTAGLSTSMAQFADSGNSGTNTWGSTFVELINVVSVTTTGSSIQTTSFNRNGDQNTIRDQGQIQIFANSISNVSEFGIVVDQGARSATTGQAIPSAPINTPTLNSQRLLPGVNISNNVVSNYVQGGIRFEGSGTGSPPGSVPFGRIVNNTLFGGATAQGVGIAVADNAGPTIMNNIVANSVTGISVDASSQAKTVVDTTVFQRNTTNLTGITATNTIALTPLQPLFVNAAGGNFYLAPLSPAIDSSRNSLSERSAMSSVKSPLAIPVSPIIAPSNDRFGQLRVDDAAVPNASGLGSNIFIDRGAIERGDFSKPKARLTTPLDNGVGVDGDPNPDVVFIASPAPLTQFVLQLSDLGVGIDHSTVIDAAFVLRQDGVALVSGTDYQFVYNRNTRQVFFQSSSVFPPQSTFTITIPKDVVKDLAGNSLQANQTNGSTVFKIIGNAPPSLTSVATLSGLKNIAKTISHAELLAASDLRVVSGHDSQFRIEQVFGNGLTIVKAGTGVSTPVVPGVTIVADGDVLTWTPRPGDTGPSAAFTVRGYDPQNAVIAPALALSETAVPVTVNLVDVPPTLTVINPANLPSATEDTVYKLTRAQLLAGSNAADLNNDLIRFRVTQVVSGSLLIGATQAGAVPVIPGQSILDDSVCLFWTPPANLNNELNGGPLQAFRVVANDGTNDSSPPVLVSINTLAVPDAPLLTTISKLTLAGKNSPFKIPFSTLQAASNATNVDGHPIEFQIASIPAGATLQIRKAATPGVTQNAPVGTIVSPGDVLIYTAPNNMFGDPVNAFQVVAYDGFNAANFPGLVPSVVVSAPPVVVPIQVLNELAPRLTRINTLDRPRYVPSTITYADLVGNSDLTAETGHTIGLRIDNIDQGTLSRGGVNLSAGDVILPGDSLVWNLPGATGSQAAFDLTAVDLDNTLTSLDPVQVTVNLINLAPTLTRVDNIVLAEEQTALTIAYDRLRSLSDASDSNNDAIGFVIKSISANGTLQIVTGGVTRAAVVGDVLDAGESLIWTPAVGVTGTAIPAFTVKATDGLLESADPNVPVTVQVRAWGSEYSLGGVWTINGQLARITQSGANLTFVNENGVGSAGRFIARDQVQATTYSTTATVDMTAADQGRLLWSNGQIWLRISLGGQWSVLSSPTATNIGKLVSVAQSGSSLTFVNAAGVSSSGALISATQLSATGLGGIATYGDGVITFANGEKWTKLDLALNYTSSIGSQAVSVLQDGSTTLRFVNRFGNTNSGLFLTPTRVQDLGLGRTGTISNGQIVWSDGEIWSKALVIKGNRAGTTQAVSITATNSVIQATIPTETIGLETIGLQLLSLNTIRGKSGSLNGLIGRRQGGKIVWSNGVTWENLDFNALNALFADIQTYPRG